MELVKETIQALKEIDEHTELETEMDPEERQYVQDRLRTIHGTVRELNMRVVP